MANKFELNLIPIQYRQKRPLVRWKDYQEKKSTNFERRNWFSLGKKANIAIICGSISNNLYIIDIDEVSFAKILKNLLPSTLTAETSKGMHFYYFSPNKVNKERIELLNPRGEVIGIDFLGEGSYAICPPSVHPSGSLYQFISTQNIKMQDFDEIKRLIITEALRIGYKPKSSKEIIKRGREIKELINKLPPLKNMIGFEKNGSHPIHGSNTGRNLHVNSQKRIWFCFRHNVGGGKFQWYAVQEGIIDCSQANKMNRRDKALVIERLKEEYTSNKSNSSLKILLKEPFNTVLRDKRIKTVKRFFYKKKSAGNKQKAYFGLAEILCNHIKFIALIDTKELLYYNPTNGLWDLNAEIYIEQICRGIVPEISKRGLAEIIDKIRTFPDIYQDRSIFNQGSFIGVKNGVLDLISFNLLQFSSDFYLTYSIPAFYDPNAICKEIDSYFKEILPSLKIRLLKEIIRYCLLPDYRYGRAFLFVGKTHTGKSTTVNLIKSFLGSKNISNLTLQQILDKPFLLYELYGKLANLSPDLPNKEIHSTGIFKALTGKDEITADRKFRNPITFENTAKLIFSANHIPATKYDDSDAYYVRWIILEFANQHLQNPDPRILDKLTSEVELSGLLNHAISGLKRLQKRGKFEEMIDIEKKREQYLATSDPIKYFVKKRCLVSGTGLWVVKNFLYKEYIELCE